MTSGGSTSTRVDNSYKTAHTHYRRLKQNHHVGEVDKAALVVLDSNQDLDSLELNDQANLSEPIGIRYARQPRATQR